MFGGRIDLSVLFSASLPFYGRRPDHDAFSGRIYQPDVYTDCTLRYRTGAAQVFASLLCQYPYYRLGINKRTYTVTLTKGIIEKLDDEELKAVIAHELSHIRNHDVRLLIISIVFVGIFAMIAQICMRWVYYASWTPRRRDEKGNGAIVLMLIALLVAAIGYFFALLMRFAISRKREYLADAGSAEMTRNPLALASALRKIAADPDIEAVTRADVAQLFIQHPGKQAQGFLERFNGLFATHPPIDKRIAVLEQF